MTKTKPMTDEWKDSLLRYCDVFDTKDGSYLNEHNVINFIEELLHQATSKAREEVVNTILEKHFHYITRDNLWSFRGNQYHEPYLADEIAKDIQSLKKDK